MYRYISLISFLFFVFFSVIYNNWDIKYFSRFKDLPDSCDDDCETDSDDDDGDENDESVEKIMRALDSLNSKFEDLKRDVSVSRSMNTSRSPSIAECSDVEEKRPVAHLDRDDHDEQGPSDQPGTGTDLDAHPDQIGRDNGSSASERSASEVVQPLVNADIETGGAGAGGGGGAAAGGAGAGADAGGGGGGGGGDTDISNASRPQLATLPSGLRHDLLDHPPNLKLKKSKSSSRGLLGKKGKKNSGKGKKQDQFSMMQSMRGMPSMNVLR